MTDLGFGGDHINPDWKSAGRVHDWRNYISDKLRGMWHTFTDEQKLAIAEQAYETAEEERWE